MTNYLRIKDHSFAVSINIRTNRYNPPKQYMVILHNHRKSSIVIMDYDYPEYADRHRCAICNSTIQNEMSKGYDWYLCQRRPRLYYARKYVICKSISYRNSGKIMMVDTTDIYTCTDCSEKLQYAAKWMARPQLQLMADISDYANCRNTRASVHHTLATNSRSVRFRKLMYICQAIADTFATSYSGGSAHISRDICRELIQLVFPQTRRLRL